MESADSGVLVDASSLLIKKVSFSIPEVTSQHDYVASEECKMRKIKRRKSRRHDDESSKSKRKKTNEDGSLSDHLKQVNSSGWFTGCVAYGRQFSVIISQCYVSQYMYIGVCYEVEITIRT